MKEETNKGLNKKLKRISKELKLLGISPSREGYWYLRDSIYLCLINQKYNIKITKDIYPTLSKKYHKKSTAIEKAIRTAIEKGWTNCNLEYAIELFANTIPYDKDRPTNSEFISTISERISLEI